jgi:hypothetical protein
MVAIADMVAQKLVSGPCSSRVDGSTTQFHPMSMFFLTAPPNLAKRLVRRFVQGDIPPFFIVTTLPHHFGSLFDAHFLWGR